MDFKLVGYNPLCWDNYLDFLDFAGDYLLTYSTGSSWFIKAIRLSSLFLSIISWTWWRYLSALSTSFSLITSSNCLFLTTKSFNYYSNSFILLLPSLLSSSRSSTLLLASFSSWSLLLIKSISPSFFSIAWFKWSFYPDLTSSSS